MEDQLRGSLQLAAEQGIWIPREHIYYDSDSCGNQDVRTGLRSLTQLLDDGGVKIVIVVSLQRLFRDQGKLQDFLHAYEGKLGVRLIHGDSQNESAVQSPPKFIVDPDQAVC